jgi:hypothetical protein
MIADLKKENSDFFKACNKESDRGVALVAAEFFDTTLERLLLSRFRNGHAKRSKLVTRLFESFGPLSTFSSKISIAYVHLGDGPRKLGFEMPPWLGKKIIFPNSCSPENTEFPRTVP